MDILLYVIVCIILGLINCVKNGGFTIEDRSNAITISDNESEVINLSDIPIGSNLSAHYNKDAFNKIIDQFHLR